MPLAQNIDTRRFVAALAAASLLAWPALAHGTRQFVNGRWFDGTRFVEGQAWWSVDGKLRKGPAGKPDEVVDLRGGYVIPPFAEAHTHEFSLPRPAQIARWLAQGIFYAKDTNSIARLVEKARGLVNRPESVDVVWALGGLTATGGHPIQIYDEVAQHIGLKPEEMEGEAWWIIDNQADLDSKWPAIVAKKPDLIKAYLEHSEEFAKRRADDEYYGERGLDPALLPKIVARARGSGLRVSVHVSTAADYRTAVASGAAEVAHLPLEKLTAADARQAADRQVWTVTTTLSHRPTDGIADLDGLHRHNLRLLRDAKAPIAFGTDGAHTVIDEIENVRRLGVFDDATLLRIATRDSARNVFPARKVGEFAEGAEASFLVLQGDPLLDFANLRKITQRIKTGHLLAPARAGDY